MSLLELFVSVDDVCQPLRGEFPNRVSYERFVALQPADRALAEKYQRADISWAVKQKGKKK